MRLELWSRGGEFGWKEKEGDFKLPTTDCNENGYIERKGGG